MQISAVNSILRKRNTWLLFFLTPKQFDTSWTMKLHFLMEKFRNVNNQTDIRIEKKFDGWDFSWQDLKNICSI